MTPTNDSKSFLTDDPFQGPPAIEAGKVRTRKNTDNVICAAPTDLEPASLKAITAAEARAAGAMPYCLDINARRSVYVSGITPDAAQSAPFYYLHARREASDIYVVPWKLGPLYQSAARPVFVFSPGRCGSTLLSNLLYEAKVPSISEPDFYTQFTAGALYDKRPEFYATEVRAALGVLTQDLAAACGAEKYFVIKLRSEVCFITRFLVNMCPEPRKSIFMHRDFEGWAKSTLRRFDYDPRGMVSKYVSGLKSLATLGQISDCHLVRYEVLLKEPDAVAKALGDFLETEISPEATRRALNRDAQKGTPLAQDAGNVPPWYEEKLEKTMALWNAPDMQPLHALLPKL